MVSISLAPGERLVLSPRTRGFREAYSQVRPRTADELRELVGLSAEETAAFQAKGGWRDPPFDETVHPEELRSPDDTTRQRAWTLTAQALRQYIHSVQPAALDHMALAIAEFLQLNDATLNVAALQDIEVGDGATLSISDTTHLVTAGKITIHSTGRIVCSGALKMTATSFEGLP
jgi:hypothetical protein